MSKLNNLPWMPIYLDAYAGGTTYFNAEQHGAYLLLLMEMWRCEGSLPDRPGMLAAIAKIPVERWVEVWDVIGGKFQPAETPGRITNARLLFEHVGSIKKAAEGRDRTARATKASVEARKKSKPLKSGDEAERNVERDEQRDDERNANTVLQSYRSSEEAKASSGADAPFDPKKFAFDTIAGAFVSAGGSEQHGRSMAGKLWNKHPESVDAVVADMLANPPANPSSYLGDVFKRLAAQARAEAPAATVQTREIIYDDEGRPTAVRDLVSGTVKQLARAA